MKTASNDAINRLAESKEKEEDRTNETNLPLIIKRTPKNKTEVQRHYEYDDSKLEDEDQEVTDKNSAMRRIGVIRRLLRTTYQTIWT